MTSIDFEYNDEDEEKQTGSSTTTIGSTMATTTNPTTSSSSSSSDADHDKHKMKDDVVVNTPTISSVSSVVTTTTKLKLLPPLEQMSIPEYEELVVQVQELSLLEAQMEFLDACRYGDVDVVRALLLLPSEETTTTTTLSTLWCPQQQQQQEHQRWLLEYQQENTLHTGLHMACANGHLSTVQLLLMVALSLSSTSATNTSPSTTATSTSSSLCQQMIQRKNANGNTPLHWAASNGQYQVLQWLLSSSWFDEEKEEQQRLVVVDERSTTMIDVLKQNDFGRSILTEGFTSQNEDVIQLLLEHSSATEDKLLDMKQQQQQPQKTTTKTMITKNQSKSTATTTTTSSTSSSSRNTNEWEVASVNNNGLLDEEQNDFPHHIHHFKLHQTTTTTTVGTTNTTNTNTNTNASLELKVRELAIQHPDHPFAAEDTTNYNDDTTGLSIWSASVICARWMYEMAESWKKKNVPSSSSSVTTIVELGSGCAVPGLTVAKVFASPTMMDKDHKNDDNNEDDDDNNNRNVPITTAANPHYCCTTKIFLTDLNPLTVENARYNIQLNGLDCDSSTTTNNDDDDASTATAATTVQVQACVMDWKDPSSWPEDLVQQPNNVDYIIGSDLIYQQSMVPLLQSVIMKLLKPGGTFLYVAPNTGREGLDLFIQTMKQLCPHYSEQIAPVSYRTNPLTNGDDEECFLHFQDLLSSSASSSPSSVTYKMYEFTMPSETFEKKTTQSTMPP